jgi:hypothetical protein
MYPAVMQFRAAIQSSCGNQPINILVLVWFTAPRLVPALVVGIAFIAALCAHREDP